MAEPTNSPLDQPPRRARKSSYIEKRFGDRGPLVLKMSGGHGEAGVDTACTRSIGDWDAARSCIPEPELRRFAVPPGGYYRVALASDGLWDFCSFEHAAKLVRGAASAHVAAAMLAGLAERKSDDRLGRLKDDTSVAVVELDLRCDEERKKAARAAAGSCCTLC